MKREPAIHVKLSSLINLLTEYDLTVEQCKQIALSLSEKSNEISHRQNYHIKVDRVVKPKAYKEVKDGRLDYLFDVITSYRLKNNQIFKDKLFKKNLDVLELEKVVDIVYDYAKEYYPNDINNGVNEYISKVFDFAVSTFNYNHINYYLDKIVNWKRCSIEIDAYPLGKDKVITTYNTYKEIYLSRFKLAYSNEIGMQPENLINFMYCFSDCVRHKALIHDWINAQFDANEYLKKAPDIRQLHGVKALQNYQKFMEVKITENPSYGKIASNNPIEGVTPKPSQYKNTFLADLTK